MADLMKNKWYGQRCRSWPIIILLLAGCQNGGTSHQLADLENPDPAVRVQAIKWAGENKITEAVPLLVDRLQEQDVSIRFFAIMSLKRITGTDNGYDYKSDAASRAQAIKKWRQTLTPQGNTNENDRGV
jgi:hypothetical protein